ncbi:hypothetical protein HK098_004080 [Nowakowskiella sp. JEL0407]|nr:hypothetical protein HK098_004080 [Nowakowskiella sp. JEL0407]
MNYVQVRYRRRNVQSAPIDVKLEKDVEIGKFAKKTASLLIPTLSRKENSSGQFYFSTENGKWISSIDELVFYSKEFIFVSPVVHIDGPKQLPFVGNLYDIFPDPTLKLPGLYRTYGPVIKLSLMGEEVIQTNDPSVAEIFLKETQYMTKRIFGIVKNIKAIGGDGLFTTETHEMEWTLARKLLVPAFSQSAMDSYTNDMALVGQKAVDIFNAISMPPSYDVDIPECMTNIVFEMIGSVAFGYSFGLLDSVKTNSHPCIQALAFCLQESGYRTFRPSFANKLNISNNRRFDRELKVIHSTIENFISSRKASKDFHLDILGYMLKAQSEHESFSDELIRDEIISFLIAGHEPTSITLSWLLYELHSNPQVEARLLQELVDVLGDNEENPTAAQISKLKYLDQCIKETLRLHPPTPVLMKSCIKDCVVPGGYKVKEGSMVGVSIYSMHVNDKIYENPYGFNPDRWHPKSEMSRPRYSFLPFGAGARECIGKEFSMQIIKVISSMILRKFRFISRANYVKADPLGFILRPTELKMRILSRIMLPDPTVDQIRDLKKYLAEKLHLETPPEPKKVIRTVDILFGSNTGTSENLATVMASKLRFTGFNVRLMPMDDWDGMKYILTNAFKENRVVLIATSTYCGQPPDNAVKFTEFLKTASDSKANSFDGLHYSVFGCGKKKWKTYQSFPKFVDLMMSNLGGRRFFARGKGNDDYHLETDFKHWFYQILVHLTEKFGMNTAPPPCLLGKPGALLSGVEISLSPASIQTLKHAKLNFNLSTDARMNIPTVIENRELQEVDVSNRSTRYITLKFQESVSFKPGDHLEVIPENTDELVQKIAKRIGLSLDATFDVCSISQTAKIGTKSLAAAIKGPCTVGNALKYFADLTGPPPRTLLWILNDNLKMKSSSPQLQELFGTLTHPGNKQEYQEFISKYRTVVDVFDSFPEIESLTIPELLCGLQVMKARRYSISSSPRVSTHSLTLTVGVINDVCDTKRYPGLCSNYLAVLNKGATINAAIRPCPDSAFRPPTDPRVPIMMICTGTGISPFRGFLQDRKVSGFKSERAGGVSQTILYYGCRNASDFIYKDDLGSFLNDGTLDELHVAYSRPMEPQRKLYVQDLMLENLKKIWMFLNQSDSKIYICGSGSMGHDVVKALILIYAQLSGVKQEYAKEVVDKLQKSQRIILDVWG